MQKKVLIVEQEKILRGLIAAKLEKEGYEVLCAEDGEEGLRLMHEYRPALAILDLTLSKLGGIELLEIFQRDSLLRQIPVIVISNSGQAEELERVRDLDVRGILVKTEFDPREVVDKVREVLGE